MCHISLFEERLWLGYLSSRTGPVPRPTRWPNVAGTPVPSLIRCLVVLRSRPSDLLTARRTMSLRSGRLHEQRCLQRRLMTPTFPLLRCRRLRCPSSTLPGSLFRPGQLHVPQRHPSAGVPAATQIADYRAPPAPTIAGRDSKVPFATGTWVTPLATIWRSSTRRTPVSPGRNSASLLGCPRISCLLWPGLHHSTLRGLRCPTYHRCYCHPTGYIQMLI